MQSSIIAEQMNVLKKGIPLLACGIWVGRALAH